MSRPAVSPHERRDMMTNPFLCCISMLALAMAATPAWSGEHAADNKPVLPGAVSATNPGEDDCQSRMRKLDDSPAEGAERLAEENLVIDYCASQYKNDKTIARLVKECAKYVEQPVLKQQFVAECQLAAFNYANALYTLKAEYRK